MFPFAPSATVTRLDFYLNDVELSVVTSSLFVGVLSLLNNNKLLDVSE